MITGILLNWKRPHNVARILESWWYGGLVSEAIVWNNNPDAPLPGHTWASVINTSRDLGLYTRFLIAQLAANDCVLIQDDDLVLPDSSLRRLYEGWLEQPDVLHGVFGRAPKPDGTYKINLLGDGEAPIVLTRALLSHRRNFTEFFQMLPAFESVQRDTVPFGNGEDIILSYVVRAKSGRLNRIHAVEVEELPCPDPIYARPGHHGHRTRLLQFCEAWLSRADPAVGTPGPDGHAGR